MVRLDSRPVAPDPSSILNLFGLLPWNTPEAGSIFFIFSLGVLPILLGISMWLQQKLNPSPTDPTQQMIFAWMPWVFMFMLGSFASGLVVYWIANNTITFTQQYLIMRSQGYKPDVFGNILGGFKRKPKRRHMTGSVAHLWRHPIKSARARGTDRGALARRADHALGSPLGGGAPGGQSRWRRMGACANFSRGSKAPALMAISTRTG